MSQQAFAEQFQLKRATLGAYEEERSEPRLETVIKIANHFSIAIDDLLTHELTVNGLLKFKGDLTTDTTKITKDIFPEIGCVTEQLAADYPFSLNQKTFIDKLPKLQLPIPNAEHSRAFMVQNLEMTHHDRGFYPNDIVIGEKVKTEDFKKLTNGAHCVAVTSDKVIFRKYFFTSNEVTLRADHKNIEDIVLQASAIKELWEVKYVFCKRIPDFSDMIEGRLTIIQQELSKLQELMR